MCVTSFIILSIIYSCTVDPHYSIETFPIGPCALVNSWCLLYKNDAGSVWLMAQNAVSREIFGGGKAIASPTPILASESLNDLVDEYSESFGNHSNN